MFTIEVDHQSPLHHVMTASKLQYEFIDDPDDALKCRICFEDVAEEPWQHGQCGKLFCEKCLDLYGRNKPCPSCKAEQPHYLVNAESKYTDPFDLFGNYMMVPDGLCDFGMLAT